MGNVLQMWCFTSTSTFFLYKYLYLRMCLILPPLIVRYLLDLEFIFIVINLYQVAVFLDIVFKKIVLLFRSDPVPIKTVVPVLHSNKVLLTRF